MKKVLAFTLSLLMLVMACVPAGALTLTAPESSAEIDLAAVSAETELAATDLAYPLLDEKLGKLFFLDTFSGNTAAEVDYVDTTIAKVNTISHEGGGWSLAADPQDEQNKVVKSWNSGFHQIVVKFTDFVPKPGKYSAEYDYASNGSISKDSNMERWFTTPDPARADGSQMNDLISRGGPFASANASPLTWFHSSVPGFCKIENGITYYGFSADNLYPKDNSADHSIQNVKEFRIIPNGGELYVDNLRMYYFPANSFIIKTGAELELVETEGGMYTFPGTEGTYTGGVNVYDAGTEIAVSELEYKTFTYETEKISTEVKFFVDGAEVSSRVAPFGSPVVERATKAKAPFLGWKNEAGEYVTVIPTTELDVYNLYADFGAEYEAPSAGATLILADDFSGGASGAGVVNYADEALVGTVDRSNRWRDDVTSLDVDPENTSNPVMKVHHQNFLGHWMYTFDAADGILGKGTAGKYLKDDGYYLVKFRIRGISAKSGTGLRLLFNEINDDDGRGCDNRPTPAEYHSKGWWERPISFSMKVGEWTEVEIPVKLGDRGVNLLKNIGIAHSANDGDSEYYIDDFQLWHVNGVNVTWDVAGETTTGTYAAGAPFTRNASKYGYAFKGWKNEAGETVTKIPDTDATLYADLEEIKTTGEYGELVYFTDFSDSTTTQKTLDRYNYDDNNADSAHWKGPYKFHNALYYNNTLIGDVDVGSAQTGHTIVQNPLSAVSNPVVKIQNAGYPRFEAYFTDGIDKDGINGNPIIIPGTYTVTYKLYVADDVGNRDVAAIANKNNSHDTGSDWAGRATRLTAPRGEWMNVTKSVTVSGNAGDWDKIGKMGFLAVSSPLVGSIYLDDFAIWFKPAEEGPVTLDTYSIRNMPDKDGKEVKGMRFAAFVSLAQRELSEEYGYIIAVTDALGGDVNKLVFNAAGDEKGTNVYGVKYVSGAAYNKATGKDVIYDMDGGRFGEHAINDEGVYFTAVLNNIPAAQYKTNLTVRAYTKVGGKYYYGKSVTKSLYDVAQEYYALHADDMSDEEFEFVDSILNA